MIFKEPLNFPAFNAGNVMKMAAEEMVSYDSFALRRLHFKICKSIS